MSRVNAGKIEVARFTNFTILFKKCVRIIENISYHKTNRVTQRIPREAPAYQNPVSAIRIFKGIKGKQLDCLIKNNCLLSFTWNFNFSVKQQFHQAMVWVF